MNLFYSNQIEGDILHLSQTEANHLRVLRIQPGATITVLDGQGHLYTTKVLESNKKGAVCSILNTKYFPKEEKPYLHVAIAPTKSNDRTEFFLEKAVELGVDEITFFISEHSERKKINEERMHKIMLSACKQSQCYHFPQLQFNVKLEAVLNNTEYDFKGIAHCMADENKTELINTAGKRNLVLIGPEGDFSSKEVEIAKSNGFSPIDLGASRLRTETAGIYVCAVFRCTNSNF